MRKILLVFAVCVCSAVFAENIVLDLSNPGDFPIEYDESGLWADVFNNDAIVYSQEFMFSHASPYSNYSNGFFASKVTAISASAGTDDQWGCMAKGGFAGEGTPYLGGLYRIDLRYENLRGIHFRSILCRRVLCMQQPLCLLCY